MESPSPVFLAKKQKIIASLQCPDEEYFDLSPKGCIDAPIRAQIDLINQSPVMVTTSSCSGRLSVFLEAPKNRAQQSDEGGEILPQTQSEPVPKNNIKPGQVGGKGEGGKWLFVSHTPVGPEVLLYGQQNEEPEQVAVQTQRETWHSLFQMTRSDRTTRNGEDAVLATPVEQTSFVHFKFEPFILHILTSSISAAQAVLSAALQAGFRESGVVGLTPHTDGSFSPMVAVRSNGLAFESIIGYRSQVNVASSPPVIESFVSEQYLSSLVELANHRFVENTNRINRFISELSLRPSLGLPGNDPAVGVQSKPKEIPETKEERRKRKKEQGLARQNELQALATQTKTGDNDLPEGNGE